MGITFNLSEPVMLLVVIGVLALVFFCGWAVGAWRMNRKWEECTTFKAADDPFVKIEKQIEEAREAGRQVDALLEGFKPFEPGDVVPPNIKPLVEPVRALTEALKQCTQSLDFMGDAERTKEMEKAVLMIAQALALTSTLWSAPSVTIGKE